MSHHTNIVRLKAAHNALSGLGYDYAFVGGAVVSLYADRVAEEIRETEDVDVLVEIYSRFDYAKLEKKLRQLGFKHDTRSNFVGRFFIEGLIVDLMNDLVVDFMPLEEKVLGFSNKWYVEGLLNAIAFVIDELHTIKIFTVPYFIAAKLEAFKGRGKNKQGKYDGRVSADFEDIVFLLGNRATVWDEMAGAANNIKQYLIDEFAALYKNPYFEEWIEVHTPYSSGIAPGIILPGIKQFIQTK